MEKRKLSLHSLMLITFIVMFLASTAIFIAGIVTYCKFHYYQYLITLIIGVILYVILIASLIMKLITRVKYRNSSKEDIASFNENPSSLPLDYILFIFLNPKMAYFLGCETNINRPLYKEKDNGKLNEKESN